MSLISGCQHSTPVSWFPVLSNVAPLLLCCKEASDKMLPIIEAHPTGLCNADAAGHIKCVSVGPSELLDYWMFTKIHLLGLPPDAPSLVRHDTCQLNCTVERGLAVGSCGQLHHCNWPYYQAAWFQSPSAPCGAGAPLFPPCPFASSSFPLFTLPFLSLALPIFFFCPSLPFLPE